MSHNVFEAGNALPPSPTVVGVAPEGTDLAQESDPLAAGVTLSEGAAPTSEGDSRVRGQAGPEDAAYVAGENVLMVGDGDVTVPGPLPPPESAQRHPISGGDPGGGNGPGAGKRSFSRGCVTGGRCSSSVRRRPGGKGADGARRGCFCCHGELLYRRYQGGDGTGTLAPEPSVTPATSGVTASMSTGAVEAGGSTRDRRGRPCGSGRGSRATRTGRGAATNRGRISRPGSGKAP